jgi:pimeloyl-ACP methyl ester carboxylesterase
VVWLWVALWLVAGAAGLGLLAVGLFYLYVRLKYIEYVVRIVQEKPLFVIPRGRPADDAEEVRFAADNRLTLAGVYLKARPPRRKGVILFGLEFGSDRWSCVPYCEFLRQAGFDIFAFEPRNQGQSDNQPGYEPLQWVTDFEVHDFDAAIRYLKSRHDADPGGIGLFGISKGGSAGLIAAARADFVRCCVTDGAFATHTTMIPYMRKWVAIYSDKYLLQRIIPTWVYSRIAKAALRKTRRQRGCRFPHLEHFLPRLRQPLLMIHGAADNYIKPEMARELFALAGGPKEFWLVEKAKHNQAFHVATAEYQRRVLEFFEAHLATRDVLVPQVKEQTLSRQDALVRK